MSVVQLGVSHHDVQLAELDLLSRQVGAFPTALLRARAADVHGAVMLSTCNRVELYVDGPDPQRADHAARTFLSEHLGEDLPVAGFPEPRVDEHAARHLFSVAVGLESMVLGESEIAGQVRRAVATARNEQTVTPALDRLFRAATKAARQVSTSTGLGSAGRSIVTVALDLIEKSDGPLAGRTALVIGTGSYARVVHAALQRRGIEDRLVYSLSDRSRSFVDAHGGERVTHTQLAAALSRADLVVTSSGAPHPVLEADMLEVATEKRSHPLSVVDLALTRDVEAEAARLSQVNLIDLEVIAQHAPREHSRALADAQRTVLQAATDFAVQEAERTADSVVVALRSAVNSVIEEEVERVRRRHDDQLANEVAQSLHRVGQELLHRPTVRSREFTREGRLEEVENALHVLLGLDISRHQTREGP